MADATDPTLDVQELLLESGRDIDKLLLLRKAQAESPEQRRRLEGLVIELMENPTVDGEELDAEDAALVVGVGHWALGRLEEAIASLAGASSPEADYFLGRCYLETGFYDRAAEAFQRAQRGKAAVERGAALGHAEAVAGGGKPDAALTELRSIAKSRKDDPDVHYLMGYCYDQVGRYEDAIEEYEKALEAEPDHNPAAFRLAYDHALRGEQDTALEHYQALASRPATYINALINLGVLHEDRREFHKAIECYRRVLRADPNHPRARMYLKDAHASLDMEFDEDRQREMDRRAELLAVPVSDFELSVRVRNCLQRMNIHTLGDLVSHTEEELLASKNFGETSLQEIKEMLAARNLRLGQDREEAIPSIEHEPEEEAPAPEGVEADQAVLATPISELDLSLRSRKCMERLGIATLGQLIEHTAEDLLASRNFGRTSLAELTECLTRYGLQLKRTPPEEEEGEEAGEEEEGPMEPDEDQQEDEEEASEEQDEADDDAQ
ncbi:MAG: DNA-directed RNA polymerase subunit alpha C-terminal domain-containing protein [Candidatus Brocadiia bacterium]